MSTKIKSQAISQPVPAATHTSTSTHPIHYFTTPSPSNSTTTTTLPTQNDYNMQNFQSTIEAGRPLSTTEADEDIILNTTYNKTANEIATTNLELLDLHFNLDFHFQALGSTPSPQPAARSSSQSILDSPVPDLDLSRNRTVSPPGTNSTTTTPYPSLPRPPTPTSTLLAHHASLIIGRENPIFQELHERQQARFRELAELDEETRQLNVLGMEMREQMGRISASASSKGMVSPWELAVLLGRVKEERDRGVEWVVREVKGREEDGDI